MDWKQYLKSQQYTDEEISNMEKTFGADKMAKAFAAPIKQLADAQALAAKVQADQEAFDARYQNEILPEMSKVYKDAVDSRTKAAALEARLNAAKEFGFLSDADAINAATGGGVVPGVNGGGTPVRANSGQVPGSPDVDPRYVQSSDFSKMIDGVPDMLGRLLMVNNEHQTLFGSPLSDINDIVATAKASGGKKNFVSVWEEKYKVADKRAELKAKQQAEHDKAVADAAIAKYVSENNHPYTRPGVNSVATRFTNTNVDQTRHPWKGAAERKIERRNIMADAINQGRAAAATGRVQ